MQRINPRSDSYEALLWDVVTNAHRYIPKDDNEYVLDLGAHFGMFSLFCAARGCLVTAYEPSSLAFTELLHTAEVAREIGGGAIYPVRKAVWWNDMPGSIGQRDPETTGSNSLVHYKEGAKTEEVECCTLHDAMVPHDIWDCVKMDIEGAEVQVLDSTSEEDFARIEYLTMELHNDILTRHQCLHVDKILRKNFSQVVTLPVKVQGKPTDQVCAYYCWR